MFLIVGIAILYVVGFIFRWNFSLWWYDLLLHFLGGIWVAIAASKFLRDFLRDSISLTRLNFIIPLFIVALVVLTGVIWEMYEFTIDELFFEERARWRAQDGNTDTMTDLMMDLLGGLVVSGYAAYKSYRTKKTSYEI